MPDTATSGSATRLTLSAVELDVVWRSLDLGPTPTVLRLPSPGRTHAERRRIVAAASHALEERGLAGPALAETLRRFAATAARLELRAWGTTEIRATATTGDDDGVLARRTGDDVVLEPCPSPATALVALLPAAPPGPGRAASVPTATLAAARDTADLVARGATPTEAGLVVRMLTGVRGRAQLGAAVADRWGVLRRRPDVLDVLDGPRGRYLLTRDGSWTTVAPTDARRLRHRAAALLAQSRSP